VLLREPELGKRDAAGDLDLGSDNVDTSDLLYISSVYVRTSDVR
jgi:hypothetical protein